MAAKNKKLKVGSLVRVTKFPHTFCHRMKTQEEMCAAEQTAREWGLTDDGEMYRVSPIVGCYISYDTLCIVEQPTVDATSEIANVYSTRASIKKQNWRRCAVVIPALGQYTY